MSTDKGPARAGLRREVALYLTAQQFLTRLPSPAWPPFEADGLARAARYFPVVGAMLGLAAGLVYIAAQPSLGGPAAAGLAIAAGVVLTGALHEDGFADCCDGVGGGASRDRALEIMRDPRVGAYGVVGLILIIGLRWSALSSLDPLAGLAALVVAFAAGRAAITPALAFGGYARADGVARGVAGGVRGWECLAAVAAALALSGFAGGSGGLVAALAALVAGAGWHWFMGRRLGGYTGDTLGGAEQVSHTAALLVMAGVAS